MTCLNVVEKGSGVLFGRTYHMPLLLARSYREIDIMHFLLVFCFLSFQIIFCRTTMWILSLSTSLTSPTRRSWPITFHSWKRSHFDSTNTPYISSTTRYVYQQRKSGHVKSFFWPTYVCDACQFKFVKLKSTTFPIHGPFNSASRETRRVKRSSAYRIKKMAHLRVSLPMLILIINIEKHYCPVLPRPFWPLGHLSYVQSLQFFMLINVVWVDFWSGPWGQSSGAIPIPMEDPNISKARDWF